VLIYYLAFVPYKGACLGHSCALLALARPMYFKKSHAMPRLSALCVCACLCAFSPSFSFPGVGGENGAKPFRVHVGACYFMGTYYATFATLQDAVWLLRGITV